MAAFTSLWGRTHFLRKPESTWGKFGELLAVERQVCGISIRTLERKQRVDGGFRGETGNRRSK